MESLVHELKTEFCRVLLLHLTENHAQLHSQRALVNPILHPDIHTSVSANSSHRM